MRPGQIERRTHDYRRHGTATLFAALNVKTSELITQFHQRHRSTETPLIRNWFAKRQGHST
jgi:hypothetical protein